MPKDAMRFITWTLEWANVYIWSCANLTKTEARAELIFGGARHRLSGIVGQQLCEVAKFSFRSGKPVFFKTLQNFLDQVQPSADVLLIDDSLYKCRFNPAGSYIIVPEIEKRAVDFFTTELASWLKDWKAAENRANFACSWKGPAATSMDAYVETGFRHGWCKMTYAAFAEHIPPLPTLESKGNHKRV